MSNHEETPDPTPDIIFVTIVMLVMAAIVAALYIGRALGLMDTITIP